MNALEVLVVAGLFFLRIGIPIMILFAVGAVIERAYARRAETPEKPRREEAEALPVMRERVESVPVETPRERVC